ncbi:MULTISPECIES: ATP-grasp domain-containing protein [Rhizobium]|uniref:ATP-grasp domain-containing protein n=1 Tax=Rhizobium TaxID=379 RepID=UPI001A8C2860|nr:MULTISPECIES: ATP-grasp domain-containing protein [Rhizobium]MBN9987384.1 ATP-grasp domain-containing protein [Rhizobium laguerreae]MBY2939615.1 ATP-grasp domain-containing protein [Rhizobium leguminosarum]
MAEKALILLEGASNGPYYLEVAQRLNLHPITLSTDPTQYDYLVAKEADVIRVDTNDLETLIRECVRLRALYDIAGITSAQEAVYATVGKLCRSFNLPGPNPVAVENCCDKFAQRQTLAEAGLPVPAYRVAVNAAEVESAAAEIGLPVIVKPAVGIGSSGVRLCRDVDELVEHTARLMVGTDICRSTPRILVEEYAKGAHYSVELMGNEVIGIGAADFGRPPHFVCREYIYPAELTENDRTRIVDVARHCLRALDLGWGPTNIDLRWTERGPVVIEVNPRLAGMPNSRLVHLAYDIDLVAEHIKLVIGDKLDLRERNLGIAAARILVADRDGVLDAVEGDSRAAAIKGVVEAKFFVQPKITVIRKGDNRDKIGHVIAVSPTLAQTRAILQCAVELMDWSITPSPNGAFPNL